MTGHAAPTRTAPAASRSSQTRTATPKQADPTTDLLALQRTTGNRAVAQLLDAPEIRSARSEAGTAVPAIVRSALAAGGGRPLDGAYRQDIEANLGPATANVRLHTGPQAAGSAQAIGAHAYTVGHDVVFAPGQFAPQTPRGMKLLLHELTHVADITRGKARRNTVYMQGANEPPTNQPAPTLPPLTLPGTGLTAFPGPLRSASLLGTRIPVPASLRLTNALSVGSGPGWVADISPRQLVLHFIDNLDLSSTTRPGTPQGRETDPAAQQRTSLIRPTITLDPSSGRLRGTAILSVGSEYPESLKGPTELPITIESTQLGQFNGRLTYGPLYANFNLRLHYDPARLAQAVRPVAAPPGGFESLWARFQTILRSSVPGINLEGPGAGLHSLLRSVQAGEVRSADFATRTIQLLGQTIPPGANLASLRSALSQLAEEITHPGFTLSGTAGIGPVPLSVFRAEAPTTVPLARPLAGAPAPFPIRYGAAGVVLAPPGAIAQTSVPAFGATGSAFGPRFGASGTAAILPTISPASISAGLPLANQFPLYAYVEVSGVTRVSNGLDLGLRLTVQFNSADLFGSQTPPGQTPDERFRQTLGTYQEAVRRGTNVPPALPNVGLTVFGTFNGPL
jgi:Domain of unknown function (DUF4157)